MAYCSWGSVVKKLSLPKKGLIFGLLAGRKRWRSWNARPDRNVFVCLGSPAPLQIVRAKDLCSVVSAPYVNGNWDQP